MWPEIVNMELVAFGFFLNDKSNGGVMHIMATLNGRYNDVTGLKFFYFWEYFSPCLFYRLATFRKLEL